MATSDIDKVVLELDGKAITVFGQKGFVSDGGNSWIMSVVSLGGMFVQAEPAPASPGIVCVIDLDVFAGNGNKIHHIVVNPNIAIRLFLEGKITPRDVQEAEVMKDKRNNKWIRFHNIEFITREGSKSFEVTVQDVELAVATIDAAGFVIHNE
ncbi:MAG: hypothetical protein AAB408_05380 [Patescibacteria group bacterium]